LDPISINADDHYAHVKATRISMTTAMGVAREAGASKASAELSGTASALLASPELLENLEVTEAVSAEVLTSASAEELIGIASAEELIGIASAEELAAASAEEELCSGAISPVEEEFWHPMG
jgi:hypothetical protein